MKERIINQFEFPSVLYDTLFGLVLYFNMDSFLEIKETFHFIFYICTFVMVIHWWLMFKSAADMFAEEMKDSALNLVLNILYLIFINYIVLTSGEFAYRQTAIFLLVLLLLDLFWVITWKYMKKWETKDMGKRKLMNLELNNIAKSDLVLLLPIIVLVFYIEEITAATFVMSFIASYCFYVFLTFKLKIIDLRIM